MQVVLIINLLIIIYKNSYFINKLFLDYIQVAKFQLKCGLIMTKNLDHSNDNWNLVMIFQWLKILIFFHYWD
jgi:hypothetical protein